MTGSASPVAATDPARIGLVIAGAGARGAYEIGALSVLVPWLRRRGESLRVVVGTSAGAMNAVLVAGLCNHPDPEEAAEAALAVWREVSRGSVFRSLVVTGPGLVARYVADVAGLPYASVTSLLDPAPLRRTLERFEHWDTLHPNVDAGILDALAVVTTAYSRSRTEVFVERRRGLRLPDPDDGRGVDYVPARITPDHVMASAAIPAAFPPVLLETDDGEPGWYLDGGVRLNAPVKPALALGADALVVLATHPLFGEAARPPEPQRPPDLFAALAKVVTSSLVDRMVEDVRALDRVNRLLGAGAASSEHRAVPYLFVGPPDDGVIPGLAEQTLRRYDRPQALLTPDFALLNRLVGGSTQAHGELLSYLLFDRDFIEALIAQGREDARATLLRVGENPWRLSHREVPAPRTAAAETARVTEHSTQPRTRPGRTRRARSS